MTTQRLGWIIAAAIVGILVASGFQGAFDKVATVDLNSMLDASNAGKAADTAIDAMKASREELLKFMQDNRAMTVDQAKNLRTLWLKDTPTAADKAALDSLKADVVAQEKKNIELGQKPNLTAEERTMLQEYSTRSATTDTTIQQWYQEFRQEIQQFASDKRVETLTKAKAAAQSVAKSKGFTLVFDSGSAIYAANDITADALNAMNAGK